MSSPPSQADQGFPAQSRSRQKRRLLVDKFARYGVKLGGVSVIIAITLIFFYLLMVVLPLFEDATIEKAAEYTVPSVGNEHSFFYVIDELAEVAVRFTDDGKAISFNAKSGAIIESQQLIKGNITSFAKSEPSKSIVVYGMDNGTAIAVKLKFNVKYLEDLQKVVVPEFSYLLGEDPVEINDTGEALEKVAIQSGDESTTIVALDADKKIYLARFQLEESLLADEPTFEKAVYEIEGIAGKTEKILIDNEQRQVFVLDAKGGVYFYDINDPENITLNHRVELTKDGSGVTGIELASGGISLIVSENNGRISQWFPVRNENNQYKLEFVRSFQINNSAITNLATEYFRKGFVTLNNQGELGLHHLTAHQTILSQKIASTVPRRLAISPRADYVLLETEDNKLALWKVHNEYPEISISSLWGKVWYEGYSEPEYVWQSSSANNDFEPKFSLVPLSFGTIKAAFYAMLLAVPLSIFGAIYTAYFMSPKLRQSVKPTIEIMEALPTVILGFLAGLWFAPFLELHMPGVFALLVVAPLGVVLFAYFWHRLPHKYTCWVAEGWQPALLLPVMVLIGWGTLEISPLLEVLLFDGNMPVWLQKELGIGYDQRNAMVVGFAMGFAVIPTIFSIAEDAIFSVPKHLTNGSLALGATPWQTLTRVIILTASPGIFSAIMIGFGRAVGETMIVLMATGNTPVIDFNIFEGMRTLSANIAVEMPESEVGSTHYRVLFLAALILFVFTFFFNTLAEAVRQRLRAKYSSL